jgi:hypothetical protein
MENWLKCTLVPGQFPGEYGVDGVQSNEKPFSLFVPANAVKFDKAPAKDKAVPGWVRVEVLDRKDDLLLVHLPRQTFQGGPFITVNVSQLETPPPAPKKPTSKPRNALR